MVGCTHRRVKLQGLTHMAQRTASSSIQSRARAVMRADRSLQKKFAGQYVAYMDAWKQSGAGKRLVRRIWAHGPFLQDVSDRVARLSPAQRARTVFTYVSDLPRNTLAVAYDLPWRLGN